MSPPKKKTTKKTPVEWIISVAPGCFRLTGDLLRIVQIVSDLLQ